MGVLYGRKLIGSLFDLLRSTTTTTETPTITVVRRRTTGKLTVGTPNLSTAVNSLLRSLAAVGCGHGGNFNGSTTAGARMVQRNRLGKYPPGGGALQTAAQESRGYTAL